MPVNLNEAILDSTKNKSSSSITKVGTIKKQGAYPHRYKVELRGGAVIECGGRPGLKIGTDVITIGLPGRPSTYTIMGTTGSNSSGQTTSIPV